MVVGDILKVVLEILMSYQYTPILILCQYPRIVDSEAVSHTTAQAIVIMMMSHQNRYIDNSVHCRCTVS